MDSQFPMLPTFFTFLVFMIFMLLKICMKSKIKDSPPGPWKLPLIGHLHHFILSELPHRCLRDLAKKHGSLMHLKLGELPYIVVSSPEVAQQVMKVHDTNFASRPFLIMAKVILYNSTDIVFAPYGGYWRQLRKICSLELLSAKRVQSFRSIREEQVSNLITFISSNCINMGLPINLGEMVCNLSYNITLRAAFSATSNKHHEAFASILNRISEESTGFCLADLFPSMKWLYVMSGMRRRLGRLRQELDEMLETIIEEHRTNKANPKELGDHVTDDLVDVLLKVQEQGDLEFPLTTDNIKAVILDILVGGTGTTSSTIEWAMSEMMKNPKVMEKAQAEVRQVFDKTKDVNESKLHELKYLKLVIKETLRLHTPSPLLLPRENAERCEIDGYEIPVKTKVIVNAWAIARDPNYWNEAEMFKPERFLDSAVDYKGTSFEYIPFGAGRRICPGMSFGVAVVELALARRKTHLCLIPRVP